MNKISAGNHTLGCLYNLIYNRKVLFISCGFNYLPGNVYRPGFVSHYYAITHNAMIGLNCYDFLEGRADYKNSLSTNQIEMENILVRKNSMKQDIEKIIVKFYQFLKNALNTFEKKENTNR